MELENNSENLEKALGSEKQTKQETEQRTEQPKMSKQEEIGYHKGALNTLLAERNEIFKMIQNVEAIMQGHLKRLQELGVKIETKEAEKKK